MRIDVETNPGERVKRWWRAKRVVEITHAESGLRSGGKWSMRGAGMGGKPLMRQRPLYPGTW
ncbi:MAG: hypothetical protein ACRD9L_24295, partial [Bryobacteraceae bacterium]